MIRKFFDFFKKIPYLEISFVLFLLLSQYQYAFSSVGMILMILVSLIYFLIYRRIQLFIPLLFFFVTELLIVSLNSIISPGKIDSLKYLLNIIAFLFIGAVCSTYFDTKKLAYSWIIIGLILSFGVYIHFILLKIHSNDPNYYVSIIKLLPTPTKDYYRERFSEMSKRPIGFFMEPALYCSFALFATFFSIKNRKYILAIILGGSLILSESSVGLVFFLVCLIYGLITFVKDDKRSRRFKIIALIIFSVLMVASIIFNIKNVTALTKIFDPYSSTNIRMFSGFEVYSNLDVWQKLFGSGFRNVTQLLDSSTINIPVSQYTEYGFANGIAEVLINCGVFGLISLVIYFVLTFYYIDKKYLPLLFCYAFALLGQTIYFNTYFVIFSVLLVFGIKENSNVACPVLVNINFAKMFETISKPFKKMTDRLLKPEGEKKSWVFLVVLSIFAAAISFFKETIFAYFYGANNISDAYNISIQIPLIIFSIITTTITTIIVPIYAHSKKRLGKEGCDTLISNFVLILEFISFIVSLLCIIFAEQLIYIFAPGYSVETKKIAVPMFRMAASFIILFNIIDINGGIMHANSVFVFPKMVNSIRNITEIIFIISLSNKYGINIAIVGLFVGLIIETIISILSGRRFFHFSPNLKENKADLKHVMLTMIPIAIGVGFDDINKTVDKIISSFLDEGSVSLISYSTKISSMISAILLTSFGVIALSSFSKIITNGTKEELDNKFSESISMMLFVSLPLSVGGIIMSNEIISLIYGRGAFLNNPNNILISSYLLKIYFASIPIESIRSICSKLLYSNKDTKTAMINGIIGVVMNVSLSLLSVFVFGWGIYGIAFATVLSNLSITIFLVIRVKIKIQIKLLGVLKESLKPIISTVVMAALCILSCLILRDYLKMSVLPRFAISVGLSTICYFALLLAMKYKAVVSGLNWLKAKTKKRK